MKITENKHPNAVSLHRSSRCLGLRMWRQSIDSRMTARECACYRELLYASRPLTIICQQSFLHVVDLVARSTVRHTECGWLAPWRLAGSEHDKTYAAHWLQNQSLRQHCCSTSLGIARLGLFRRCLRLLLSAVDCAGAFRVRRHTLCTFE